jgi:sugar lactone lactonase YvrE
LFRAGVGAILLLLPVVCTAQAPPSYTITTFAGNGTGGFDGDAGQAISAELYLPFGLAVDGSGNLFIGDMLNNRVRKVSTDGIIVTVAGSSSSGFAGDAGAATSAQLKFPSAVAAGSGGVVYVSDTINHVVRKIGTDGMINAFAGTGGTSGYAGDFVVDSTADDNGVATLAALNDPIGLAVDKSGDVYIADTFNHVIRRVDTKGIITTVVGTGTAGSSGDGGLATSARLNYPQGIALDGDGNLYIADTFNHKIRKVTTDGLITTIAGTGDLGFAGDGGDARKAIFQYPKGVVVDASGNVFVLDCFNGRVRRISAADGTIKTIAGNGRYGYTGDGGPATKAAMRFPCGLAMDASGNIYIADTGNQVVRVLTPDSTGPTSEGAGTVPTAP